MKFYSQADDMRDYCIFYLINFLIVWTFNEAYAIQGRNEKSQQTFVVRYKNGDQTIPVTVVLDDKKQTEYVINMSPRTPDKSVTLYDFKQRTIAYKDLTNRECFLGRLTDETLNHEIDALSEVQSPIESSPKVLSLVPHKSALTPTEIRNIAGQKTAVFCRKMNTWLIMPQGHHNILKREVDEIEERSYSRHGFHTVKYSHQGRETRRRYRKPSATSSQSTHEQKRISEQQGSEHGLQDNNSSSKNMSKNNSHFENQFRNHGGEEQYNYLLLPKAKFEPSDHLKISNENLNLYSDKGDRPLETDLNSLTHKSLNGQLHLDSLNNENKEFLIKHEDGLNNLNHGETIIDGTHKKYIQSPEWDPLFHSSNLHNLNFENGSRNANNDSLNLHKHQSNIETEGDFSNERLDIPEGINFLSGNIPDEPTENPDVSINVLEIPKISKKFESLDRTQGIHEDFVQPDEDVHSIFEGFHNLNGNISPSQSPDSHSSISLDMIHNHQTANNIVDDNSKAFENKKSQIHDRVSLDNFYDKHTPHIQTPVPVTKHKNFLTNPSESKNVNNIGHSDSLNKNINHHQHKSEVLFKNNFLSGNFNPESIHSQINIENKDNINPNRHSHLNKHDSLSNFNNNKYSNDTRQNLHKFVTNQPVFLPNQVHLQDILRSFKPDEIVIDIEKIPTAKPPESTSGFRGRDTSFTRNYEYQPSLNKTYPFNLHGRTRNFDNTSNPGRTINDSRKLSLHRFHLSKMKTYPFHNSDQYSTSLLSNNFLRSNPKEIPPSFLDHLPRLGALPPGVSLHPRHPQAPYADMVRTNMLHTLPQRNTNRPIRLHRQRHHRRKDHYDSSTCCKSNSRFSTCCSWHLRRGIQVNSSCCASSKHRLNLEQRRLNPAVHSRRVKNKTPIIPNKDNLPAQVLQSRDNLPFMQRKIHDDKKDRCQKEKMCRTVYESTQKVMVCRNINVDGC